MIDYWDFLEMMSDDREPEGVMQEITSAFWLFSASLQRGSKEQSPALPLPASAEKE